MSRCTKKTDLIGSVYLLRKSFIKKMARKTKITSKTNRILNGQEITSDAANLINKNTIKNMDKYPKRYPFLGFGTLMALVAFL